MIRLIINSSGIKVILKIMIMKMTGNNINCLYKLDDLYYYHNNNNTSNFPLRRFSLIFMSFSSLIRRLHH